MEAPLVGALPTLRAMWRDAAQRRGTIAGANESRVMDLVGALPTSSYFRHRLAWPLEMWWLAAGLTGVQSDWLAFDARWHTDFGSVGELRLQPVRRYAARHAPVRVGLPLVEVTGADLPTVLAALVDVAQQTPTDFANVHQVENHDLGLEDSSLLLRLLIRSLQVAIGDVGRESAREPLARPELVMRPAAVPARLATWIGAVTPAALQADTAATRRFSRVVEGIKGLLDIPPDRLERLLAATADCAAYRIDPWVTALPTRRLDDLLATGRAQPLVGAYGWVDAPRPGTPGPTVAGLLHAPSPGQALTAAVLRDRAVNDPTAARWDLDLTSRTVRAADRLAEQVRTGAHLAEAVGREVERVVAAGVDVTHLRERFPLRAEHAGRRTCDGLAVLAADPSSLGLDAERLAGLDELRAALDAYGDLLVAEAVHHVTERRPDIAGAVMDAAAGLSRPPELALLRTPRSGRTISSEVLLVVPARAAPAVSAEASPARLADPSTFAFLVDRLGEAGEWEFHAESRTVTLVDLGLQPPDALALSLDDLLGVVRETAGVSDGTDGTVTGSGLDRYRDGVRLVGLVGRRPATPADLDPLPDAPDDASAVLADLAARYTAVHDAGTALVTTLRAASSADPRLGWAWGIVA
ncbi:hypothetical protein, partial [Nostocoides japonicum]|uniref:hypothetical protein n=1 Tax=Nostocoides japonicum TaxID=99481 RepID=UPI00065B706B